MSGGCFSASPLADASSVRAVPSRWLQRSWLVPCKKHQGCVRVLAKRDTDEAGLFCSLIELAGELSPE
jgi:hypothetical protein